MKEEMKKLMNRRLNAYLTLEASFIMPILIFLTVFICIFCFYLYNCCVIYQACYISALRGSQIVNASSSEIKSKVEEYIDDLLDNQIYEYVKQSEVQVGMFQIKTSAKTKTTNIVQRFDVFEDLEMKSSCESNAIITHPIKLIRIKY